MGLLPQEEPTCPSPPVSEASLCIQFPSCLTPALLLLFKTTQLHAVSFVILKKKKNGKLICAHQARFSEHCRCPSLATGAEQREVCDRNTPPLPFVSPNPAHPHPPGLALCSPLPLPAPDPLSVCLSPLPALGCQFHEYKNLFRFCIHQSGWPISRH